MPDDTAKPGLLLVISGPSGVGKTTIVGRVRERTGGVFSVSATTRPRTEGEVDGRDYYFISETRFQRMIEQGEFLEHAQVFGRHYYGTPRQPVTDRLEAGELVILDIDVQGAINVRKTMPGAFMVFIQPPSEEELLRRLRSRGRDDDEAIQRRFTEATREIELARGSHAYDAFVTNDHLDRAVDEVCSLIDQRRRLLAGDAAASTALRADDD